MSTRRAARTLDERVASIEEFVRRLQADTAISPTDTRFLYSARGDVLAATGPNDPQPVDAGTPFDVLTLDASGMPAWESPDRVRESIINVTGTIWVGVVLPDGTKSAVALAPGPDGAILVSDSTTQWGVRWV